MGRGARPNRAFARTHWTINAVLAFHPLVPVTTRPQARTEISTDNLVAAEFLVLALLIILS